MSVTPIAISLRAAQSGKLSTIQMDNNWRNLVSGIQVVETGKPSFRKNYFKKASVVVDNMASAATNWNNSVTGVTLSDSSVYAKTELGLTNALQLSCTASFSRIRRTITGTVFAGTIDLWVYISSDPPTAASLSLLISKDAMVSSISMSYTQAQYLRSGWNRLSINVAEDGTTWSNGTTPAITGSTTFADTMITLQLQFGNFEQNSPTTGSPCVIAIGGIFQSGEGQANILMNWDDTWGSQWDIFNIMRARELTGSLSVIPAAINGGTGLTMTQLRTMYDWGWDVVNHTLHSTTGNIASDSDSDVRAKIGGCRDWMVANGFTRTAHVLVWPENNYNDRVIAIAQEYGITVMRGSRNRITRTHQGIDNIKRLGSADFGGKTLAQAIKLLDAAELYKGTQIIFGHKIVGTDTSPASGGTPPVDTLEWNRSDYLAFADNLAARIAAGTLHNINYTELLNNCRIGT